MLRSLHNPQVFGLNGEMQKLVVTIFVAETTKRQQKVIDFSNIISGQKIAIILPYNCLSFCVNSILRPGYFRHCCYIKALRCAYIAFKSVLSRPYYNPLFTCLYIPSSPLDVG